MFNISDWHIDYAARMLYARLTRPSTIDVKIYPLWVNDIEYRFDQHCGRFIGCFDRRPDGMVCFYLAGRSDPDGALDHLFVFYFNANFKSIQDHEVAQLKTCIPSIGQENCPLRVGVININFQTHASKYLSAIINSLDNLIHVELIEKFQECQVFDWEDLETPILFSPCPVICSGEFKNNGRLAVLTRQFGRELVHVRDLEANPHVSKCPRKPEAIILESRDHLIGAVVNEGTNHVHLILSHHGQFESGQHFDKVKNIIKRAFDKEPTFVCTRLHAQVFGDIECNGDPHFYAWKLVLAMLPHALTNVQLNDLIHIFRLGRVVMDPDRAPHMHKLRDTGPSSQEFPQPGPSQIASDLDSQATVILDPSEIKDQLAFWKEVSAKRRTIKDSLVPPVHGLTPFTDLTQGYLELFPSYEEAIDLIVSIRNHRVKSYASRRGLTMSRWEQSQSLMDQSRFIVFPLTTSTDRPAMVVLDKTISEWIYMNPDNADYNDQANFYTNTVRYIQTILPELVGYTYRVVPMTSSFHVEYPKLHLLMALYVIGRLFPYCIGLPKKVIYGEWELRKYASNICTELQIVNAEHNISKGLVDHRGRLLEGAHQSLPSPLHYQVSVSPKDQCMFCKKRGYKNLGRHMCMAHGGQAGSANLERRLAWEE